MEEHKGYSSSTHEDSDSVYTNRGLAHPDVPHDVDTVFYSKEEQEMQYYLNHLNDPNFDLEDEDNYKRESTIAASSLKKKQWDTESTAYSTTESRYTAGFE
jgi:hypothetical protein